MGAALFIAAHFSLGFIIPTGGGSGGNVLFPFGTDSTTRWAFGSLEGSPLAILIPLMIGLAGIAVLAFALAFLATFGWWVPASFWRPLVLIGAACSASIFVLHPSVWVLLPLVLDGGLAWIAWTAVWTPIAAGGGGG